VALYPRQVAAAPADPLVLALDIGTSSVRAGLYDRRARPLPGAHVQLAHLPRVASDGTSELDADRLLARTVRCVSRLRATAGQDRFRRIVAVGASSTWHGLLAASGAGVARTPAVLWADTRSWRAAEKLIQLLDSEAVHQRTGAPIHPTYWPAKIEWLRDAEPRLRRSQIRWISPPDLLYWKLFGRLGTSLSMASGTGLLRLDGTWDPELLEVLQVDPADLPPIREFEQGLQRQWARRWPELAQVPWLHAAGDGALANLGSGCIDPGQRALTVGTSGALRVIHGQPLRRIPAGLWTYRVDSRRLVTGGALSNGGNLYAWLLQTLRLDPDRLERQLSRLQPGAHGLTFLPLLAGERSPGFAAHATGAVAGLTSATTALDIARAGLEGVAVEFAIVDRLLDQALPAPRRVVASGTGILSSPAWMQLTADALGRPVAAGRATEASSRGAAILVLEHLGLASADLLDPGVARTFTPRAGAGAVYGRAVERREALYEALRIAAWED
jgi:gluconokinase